MTRSSAVWGAAALAALGALALWWAAARPVPVPGHLEERLQSLSFSPYRRGQSPLLHRYPSARELDQDLALIATVAAGVRTYTSLEGFDRVPELAAQHGLRVTMGAWLGSDSQHNRKEIEALVRVANAHPGTVTRVIVGNETLVRGEIQLSDLIADLRRVRARVHQPVSYADVPEVWLYYPQLAREVDFITVHVLPYWRDQAIPYAGAVAYLRDTVAALRARFPGKPLLVGETGWPADGRARGPALPGRAAQAGYLRLLPPTAAALGIQYNVIEAFDQPWKGALEGRVGAHWGVLTLDREPKYPPSGPIDPLPGWPRRAIPAILAGTALTLLAARGGNRPRPAVLLGLAAAAQGLATLAVLAADRLLGDAFTTAGLAWALLDSVLSFALAAAAVLTAGVHLTGRRPPCPRLGPALLAATLLLLLLHSARLTFAGHLLDIPLSQPAVPSACLLLLGVLRLRRGRGWVPTLAAHALFQAPGLPAAPHPRWRRPAGLVALLLLGAALGVLTGEAFDGVAAGFGRDQDLAHRLLTAWGWLGANPVTNAWAAQLVLLALPWWASARLAGRPPDLPP
jgi:exo-beta-1,3-glucanase (GH17 family)